MSRNYKRYCRLIIAGNATGYDVSAMRIAFRIKHGTVPQPKQLEARIYNLSKATAKAIQSLHEIGYVQLDAGYEGNSGTIFKGNLTWVNIGRENPTDTYCDIFAGDGDAGLNMALVNKTFAAGSTPQDHYNHILDQYGQFGITKGLVSFVDLSQPKYPRAVTLVGMATQALRTLADSKNALTYVHNGQLHIVDKGHSPQVGVTVLNSSTGLIGMPVETPEGIKVRALINPNYSVNTRLQINQSSINRADPVWAVGTEGQGGMTLDPQWQARMDALATADGIYRVLYIDWEGDTRGNPWYADMTCIGESGSDAFVVASGQIRTPSQAEGPAGSTPNVPPGAVPSSPVGGRSPGPV
jgi:hypothetical protein